ncbi:H-NS family nucleoid-associated regulatory protein [Morganella morganii subsp. sibonii]
MNDLTKNDEYEITRKTLASLSSIRGCFKHTPIDIMDDILGKLVSIKEEKQAEFRQFEQEAGERDEKRIQAIKLLEDAGLPIPPEFLTPITAEYLATGGQAGKKRSKKVSKPGKAKFAWKQPDSGEWLTYSGRGRMANWIDQAKAAGETDETLMLYAEEYNKEMGFE